MTAYLKQGAVAVFLAAGLVLAGCGDITSVNENPNSPEDVRPRFLFPAIAQQGVEAAVFGYPSLAEDATNQWVQHWAALQYGYQDRYEFEADFSDGWWEQFWLGPVPDAQTMVELGREEDRPNVEAVGLIMKSFLFQAMTDIWGDLPYSEASKPEDAIAPTYDSQEEIYDGIISDLKRAQDIIDPGAPLFERQVASFDIIYGGDMEKWRRFANSLRLRAGMRLSEVKPTKAASVVQSAVSDGVIETPAQQPILDYPGSPPNESPFAVLFRERLADYRASATMVDTLAALDDPRLAVYFDPAPADGEFRGKQNGTTDAHGIAYETLSDIGSFWKETDLPTWIMPLGEVQFLRAEAAARGWIGGDAETFYENGIRASMRRMEVPETDIDDYLQQSEVQWDADSWKQRIALQKWIALYGYGNEAWAEYRRLNLPELAAGPAAELSQVPLRAPYPAMEEDLNSENLQAAIQRQGGDNPTVPVWWDVN